MHRGLVAIGILLLGAGGVRAEKQRFLLTHPGGMAGEKVADISLSAYRLGHPALKRMAARGKLSPRRWVEIEDAVIAPGHGEGLATIDGMKFRVRYAWRGLTESDIGVGAKRYGTVLGWTVRIEGLAGSDLEAQMKQLREGILKDENGGRMTRDVPLRRYLSSMRVKSLAELRAKWVREHEQTIQLFEHDADPRLVELARELAQNGTSGIDQRIADLEAKGSVEMPIQLRHIEPWTLK